MHATEAGASRFFHANGFSPLPARARLRVLAGFFYGIAYAEFTALPERITSVRQHQHQRTVRAAEVLTVLTLPYISPEQAKRVRPEG